MDALDAYSLEDGLSEALKENKKLRRALFMCAASCQGGHSDAGAAAAETLGVPFPVRMENLKKTAIAEGFNPDELWPWLKRMEEARASLSQQGEENNA